MSVSREISIYHARFYWMTPVLLDRLRRERGACLIAGACRPVVHVMSIAAATVQRRARRMAGMLMLLLQ